MYVETVLGKSDRQQCSTIGYQLYQNEISKKVDDAKNQFNPHFDPYRNNRNNPLFYQSINAAVKHDAYQYHQQRQETD